MLTLRIFKSENLAQEAEVVCRIWNASATHQHGFFPLSPEKWRSHVAASARFKPERLVFAEDDGEAVGMIHWDLVRERHYTTSAAIDMIAVMPEYRCRGIGSALLSGALGQIKALGVTAVDGMGAWPYSPFYNTLIDGSERSGPVVEDKATLDLFRRHGFQEDRRSLIMRIDLLALPDEEPDSVNYESFIRQGTTTWLDYVFRGWDLLDHRRMDEAGMPVSQCITTRMDEWSDSCGIERYALFGVNTRPTHRGRGLAYATVLHALHGIREHGAAEAELHVYADNDPAVRLYQRLGFKPIAETVVLKRY